MAFTPAHRRKKDPLRRQILGTYRAPPIPPELIHVFVPSGRRDVFKRRICAECGGVEPARVHDVPPPPDGAAEIDKRRGGE